MFISSDTSPSSSVTTKTSVSAVDETEQWTSLLSPASHSCSSGHALILVLVCQKFVTASSDERVESGDQEWDSWEPLSSEREHWISLSHQLELLTLVSNLIGQDSMTRLPTAPHASINDADSAAIDPSHIDFIASEYIVSRFCY